DAHLLNGPQLAGGVSQNNVDELMSVSDDVFDAALKETGAEAAPAEAPKHASEADVDAIMASEADVDAIMAGGDEPMDAAAIDDMFASAPAADDEEEDDEFAGADPDATLDEAAIERLFDSEVGGGTHEAADEAEADAEWELTEEVSEEDGEDPLKQLSEAERQALFN
ncbi:MAG: chemotaxis protein, partial [Pseudomonadota bacterium]|nr:chemotaxis protein [Pseudomonadota bacterium]